MKKLIAVFAVLGLSACMGGGDGSDDGPAVDPEVLMNQTFETLLNNVRTSNSRAPMNYDTRLITTASEYSSEKLSREAVGDMTFPDVGDIATANGYLWDRIGVADQNGSYTVESILQFWEGDFVGSQIIDDSDVTQPYQDFGIAKVEQGGVEKWAIVAAFPK